MDAMVINTPVAQADPYAYPYEDGFSTTFWSDFSIADPSARTLSETRSIAPLQSGSQTSATLPISSWC